MAIIITIAQQKGGAGKTSLAAHLAAAWAAERRVGLLDLDPQQSLSAWYQARLAQRGAEPRLVLRAATGFKASSEIGRLGREADLVIVDTPPHAETATRLGVRVADLVLVPVQPSPMDLWATRPTLQLAADERRPVLAVLNRLPARGRLAEEMRRRLVADGMRLAQVTLGNRQDFAAALLSGGGVTETAPQSAAAEEIRRLAGEILAAARA
jgi:chromosome partitioning protein